MSQNKVIKSKNAKSGKNCPVCPSGKKQGWLAPGTKAREQSYVKGLVECGYKVSNAEKLINKAREASKFTECNEYRDVPCPNCNQNGKSFAPAQDHYFMPNFWMDLKKNKEPAKGVKKVARFLEGQDITEAHFNKLVKAAGLDSDSELMSEDEEEEKRPKKGKKTGVKIDEFEDGLGMDLTKPGARKVFKQMLACEGKKQKKNAKQPNKKQTKSKVACDYEDCDMSSGEEEFEGHTLDEWGAMLDNYMSKC